MYCESFYFCVFTLVNWVPLLSLATSSSCNSFSLSKKLINVPTYCWNLHDSTTNSLSSGASDVWWDLQSCSLSSALLKCFSTATSTDFMGHCPCSLIKSQFSSLIRYSCMPSCRARRVRGLLQIPVMNMAPRPMHRPRLSSSFTRPPILPLASRIVTWIRTKLIKFHYSMHFFRQPQLIIRYIITYSPNNYYF